MTVNVHPDIETLNQALLDFIDVFRWRNVAILYKGTEGELLSFQLQRYSAPIATTILCHCEICLSFSWNLFTMYVSWSGYYGLFSQTKPDYLPWPSLSLSCCPCLGLPGIKSVLNADFLQHRSSEDRIDTVFWEMKDINQTLKELRYNQPYKHIIVELRTHEIRAFLGAARGMGLLTSYHHYMFTSLVSTL